MSYKIVSFLCAFFAIFSQIESKSNEEKTVMQCVKAQSAALFEKIKKPILHSYYVSKAIVELFFEKKIAPVWNYLDKETRHVIICSLFLSGYYGIHILAYPTNIAQRVNTITLKDKIVGGIAQGTAGIIFSILVTIISTAFNGSISTSTYQHILLPML